MVGDIINEKDVWLGKNYNFHQPEWAGYQQFTLGFNTKQIQEVHTIFFKKPIYHVKYSNKYCATIRLKKVQFMQEVEIRLQLGVQLYTQNSQDNSTESSTFIIFFLGSC